jgi:hypothetical protein
VGNPTQLSEKSMVTQRYLHGKSMNQIAIETGISKGKVHYLINDWKNKMGSSDIGEIKQFAGLLKKSGISIEQCAEGFRTTNILKGFGIKNDDIEDDGDDSNGITGNSNAYKEFSTFVEEFYKNCKTLNISPAIILSWIKDLLDFNSTRISSSDPKKTSFSFIDIDSNEGDAHDKTQTTSAKEWQDTKEFQKNITKLNPKSTDGFSTETTIPFVSQVSFYIAQKKKELARLSSHQKAMESNIQKIKEQESRATENLNHLSQTEKFALDYIKWFHSLEKALRENHSINIREDILSFSQLINDFKEHGYDVEEIIQEYLKSLSIKLEIKTHKAEMQSLQNQKNDLTESLAYLESQTSQHRQTMGIYRELEGMKFGLKEIKQLWNSILEIAEANGISHLEAVSKFLKDMEEQYDDKLGFEAKIKEKRGELALVNRELSISRQILSFTPLIGPSLSNLFQKGIGEQDIVGMSQLVETCTSNKDFSSSGTGPQKEDRAKDKGKDTNNGNIITSRSENWKILAGELKKYGNIRSAIREQQENQDRLQKEVNHLTKQKQDASAYLQIATSFINAINSQISHYKGYMEQLNRDLNHRINMSSSFSHPFILIVNKNDGKDKDGTENQDDEKTGKA